MTAAGTTTKARTGNPFKRGVFVRYLILLFVAAILAAMILMLASALDWTRGETAIAESVLGALLGLIGLPTALFWGSSGSRERRSKFASSPDSAASRRQ